jgi:DNA-binding MarR family transcriptional regulator
MTQRTSEAPGVGPAQEATDDVPWLDHDQQRAWRAFLRSQMLLFAALDRELAREAGIPLAYYELLVRLSEAPERRLRMSDLAEESNQSRSRLSHAIARLGEYGWVERHACDDDRRGAYAELTDAGFAALAAAAPAHVRSVRRHLIDRLTPEQVAQLEAISLAIGAPLATTCDAID